MASSTCRLLPCASARILPGSRCWRRQPLPVCPLARWMCASPASSPAAPTRTQARAAAAAAAQPSTERRLSTSSSSSSTTARLPEFSLSSHVILVTGAARGLGLTCAEALLEAGAIVYALDRLPTPTPDFGRVQRRAAEELGTNLHYRQIDVCDVANLNRVVAEIADEEGRMDGLIAAAGVQQETPALDYGAEDARRMLDVNVVGVFMTSQAVARQMVRFGTKGSIALIASMSGTVANRGLFCPAYNASKAAVLQLARNLASEWGAHNIRVNTISPGYIVTAMVEKLFETMPERRTLWASQNMLGRVSDPEEYRGAAVFLMSDASSFMTASDLRMDGGHSSW